MHRMTAFVLVAVLGVSMASANTALQSFTGGTLFATYQADGDTVGWFFNTSTQIQVTHLGFWDDAANGGAMLLNHDVGLWTSAGSLLSSTTITPTSALTSNFRYEAISPVVIPAGSYVIGAFYAGTGTNADGYVTSTTARVTDPVITITNSARDPDGAQTMLQFPSVTGAATGRFGPNFQFVVPEPTSLALLVLSLVMRRR